MKKLLAILAIIPLTVALNVSGAPRDYTALWDPLPTGQTFMLECQNAAGVFTEIGRTLGNAPQLNFTLDGNPGDSRQCRGFALKTGLPNSAPSGVAVAIFPLLPPSNLRIQAVP